MRALNFLGLAILAAGVASLKNEQKGTTDKPTKSINAATNKYIVEFEKVCRCNALSAFSAAIDTFIVQGSIAYMTRQFASPSSVNSTYFRQFDCGDLFNGVVIETEVDNVDTLSAVHGVANVWPMKTIPMASAIQQVKAAPDPKNHNYSVHQWTGVDQLHARGIRGKDVTIAIIDTGLDYTHEAVSHYSV